jgi:NADPH:quinone reductase-like Zn-dependent oxidoreductase
MVIAVAGNRDKAELASSLGADYVINRQEIADWGREVYRITDKRGVDMVVDNVGSETMKSSIRAVTKGGRIVIVGNTTGPKVEMDLRFIFGKQISLIGSTMGSHHDFDIVTGLLWSGRLKPVIHRVMSLSKGREAYEIMESGNTLGKIVLEP